MSKYLYGAEIHGIQNFIFSTNKLKEMVGASQLIADVPKQLLKKNVNEDSIIQLAAGGIKCLLTDEQKAKQLYQNLPKLVAENAPEVSISQYIVNIEEDLEQKHFDELQRGLDAQRQTSYPMFYNGIMGSQISRETGKAIVGKFKNDFLDQAALTKRRKTDNTELNKLYQIENYDVRYPLDLEELTKDSSEERDNWIAVIHADGNNLGKTIRSIISAEKDKPLWYHTLTKFSNQLDIATKTAFEKAVLATFDKQLLENAATIPLPLRPIILGGDDLTVIINADNAITFMSHYLEAFEVQTREKLQELNLSIPLDGFSACAGIAFTKTKFPFHYGVSMAEALCKEAKNRCKAIAGKGKVESALMFHRIRDAIFDSYEELKERELDFSTIQFDAGPYVLNTAHTSLNTIVRLQQSLTQLKEQKGLPAHLRQWLTGLRYDPDRASLLMDRIEQIYSPKLLQALDLKQEINNKKSRVYDLLNLYAVEKSSNA